MSDVLQPISVARKVLYSGAAAFRGPTIIIKVVPTGGAWAVLLGKSGTWQSQLRGRETEAATRISDLGEKVERRLLMDQLTNGPDLGWPGCLYEKVWMGS